MADRDDQTRGTGQQVERGATGDIPAGNALLGTKPGTASHAREPCEKDDSSMVKNPQVMEDYKKAVEKQTRGQSGAEGGLKEGGSSGGTAKDADTAPANP